MADILELVMKQMPIEMANKITSYLGQSKSAEVMEGIIQDQDEFLNDINENQPHLSFVDKWQKIKIYWRQISNRNHIDIQELSYCADKCCRDCDAKMEHFGLFLQYGCKCEFCYASHLGQDVFDCEECWNFKTLEADDLFLIGEKWYCQSCYYNRDESEEESEIEESENAEEFWQWV
jgi:hypothetical protein